MNGLLSKLIGVDPAKLLFKGHPNKYSVVIGITIIPIRKRVKKAVKQFVYTRIDIDDLL